MSSAGSGGGTRGWRTGRSRSSGACGRPRRTPRRLAPRKRPTCSPNRCRSTRWCWIGRSSITLIRSTPWATLWPTCWGAMERGPGWRGRWLPRPPVPWPIGGREGLGPSPSRWWTARERSPHGSSSRPQKNRAALVATASPTGSTTVVKTWPGLATAPSEDASRFLVVGLSEDGPPGGSHAGPAEQRIARLVREMFDVCGQRGESRFEAPGLDTPPSEDASRFLAAGPSEDGPPGGSHAGPAEQRIARLVREMFDVCGQRGESRFETPGLDTPPSEDASRFLAAGPSEDGPPGGSHTGPAEERIARLVREMFDVCGQSGESRFEAPGLDTPPSEDASRFLAAGPSEDGPPGGSHAGPAEQR